MKLSRFTLSALAAASVAALSILPSSAHAQTADKIPFSADPAITGSASAPITVTVKRRPLQQTVPPTLDPSPDIFPFTVTGKDLDTWQAIDGGARSQVSDDVVCTITNEEFPTISGPNKRGVGTDGTVTFDFIIEGLVVSGEKQKKPVPTKVYINTYRLSDNVSAQGRNTRLNDANPLDVQQMITVPGYQ